MVKRILHSLLIMVIVLTFAFSSRQASAVVPQAQRCTPANGVLNTAGCHGYVKNTMFWTSTDGINGGPIIYSAAAYAIPFTVDSAATLESFMAGLLNMSSPADYSYNYNKAGAAFIVDTMLDHTGGGNFGNVTAMIQYAKDNFYPNAANNEMGWTTWVDYYSSGVNPAYKVDWGSPNTAISIGAGMINTTHACPAGTPSSVCEPTNNAAPSGSADAEDFAWYAMATGESETTHPITFFGPNGTSYMIRRECGNPLGGPTAPPPPPPVSNYNLQPNVTSVIKDSSGNPVAGSTAQVGDTIVYTYAVDNKGTDTSVSAACTVSGKWYSGVHTVPSPADSAPVLAPQPATGCPEAFTAGNHTLTTETVAVTAGLDNGTVCRSLYVSPSSPTVASLGSEACITIAAQPYFKVFGGDVSVGEGIPDGSGSCSSTSDSNAAIQSWNDESATYAGAGAQYAARALAAITNFASGQNGGSGTTPYGLSFANTTTSGSSVFGGSLVTPLACMNEYYDTTGASALTTTNVGTLASGPYSSASGITIAGNQAIGTGKRVQVYVQGNVYIDGNITYSSTGWSVTTMPLFELVVKGNIYIDSNVTQLDGMYVAEPNGTPGTGVVYTCATAANTACSTSDANFYTTASKQLTVNGSVIANQVQLMRTYGTVSSANTGETPTSSAAAEVFNYNPTIWIAKPIPTTGGTSGASSSLGYDSITSLPPIL